MGDGQRSRAEPEPAFVRDSKLLRAAHELAISAHADQRRRGSDGPFVVHPLAVASRLLDEGYGEEVVAAAIVHDVVEDSETNLGEIVERLGARVGELVGALTEDDSIEDWAERKRALRRQAEAAGPDAAAIYAADKLSNVRDTRVLYAKLGEAAGERFAVPLDLRLEFWHDDAEMAARLVRAPALVADLRAELEGLERERRAARERVAR
jgi:(p)ppGpp synthase/HD superfamily hydrolase